MWEDEVNLNGGKWIVRLRKGVAQRYWEDVVSPGVSHSRATVEPVKSSSRHSPVCVSPTKTHTHMRVRARTTPHNTQIIAILGGQFRVGADEICGAVLSVRYQEDLLSIWYLPPLEPDGTP